MSHMVLYDSMKQDFWSSHISATVKATTNMLPYTPNKRFSKEFKREKKTAYDLQGSYHFGCW